MKHLKINMDKCIGCGLCKSVCIRDNIEIIDKKAVDVESNCFDCGQCATLCPVNAIEINAYSNQPERVESYNPDNLPVSYDDLLQFYKQRRSCRWFKDEKISHKTFEMLSEAAYYSPNRQNIQDVEFVLIEDNMDEFINHVYSIIKAKENEFDRIKQVGEYLCDEKRNPKRHPLLWEAQQLLLVFSQNYADATIAMTRLELLAYTLGLGGFYSLFISMSDEIDHDRLMEFFPEIDSDKHMCLAFAIGIPRVKYIRTRPHKKIKLTYK
ncbi:MAG: nitroreductase family protein [Methanosphaera sp.]|nr:nitroreductase family protein [Methanosphaera sp.]